MKGRGKAVETYNGNNFSEFNYSGSDLPCQKHPFSSSVGVCAFCLKDRLIKLVCSECGERRLSSCSCSEIPPHFINSDIVDVGSVGRVSFLIENEKTGRQFWHPKSRKGEEGLSDGEAIVLKRSSSSHVEDKRKRGFWKIKKLFFRKKKEKGVGEFDDKSDFYVSYCMGVSRSRSLCSFRDGGGAFNDPEEERSDFSFSSAKISDFSGGFVLKSEKKHSFIEGENGLLHHKVVKKGGTVDIDNNNNSPFVIPNSSVSPAKESYFLGMDDSGFIDLKLDLSSESNKKFSAPKRSDLSISDSDLKEDGIFFKGGSCKITLNDDTEIKRGTKGHKVWRWIFRLYPGRRSAASQRDNGDHILKT